MRLKFSLSQLNLILLFVGYFGINYLTVLFSNDDFFISKYYRYIQIAIAIFAIFSRFKWFIKNLKQANILLYVFIVIYTIRLIYDNVNLNEIDNGIEHIFQFDFISILPALAIFTLKKNDIINLDLVLKYIVFILLLLSLPYLGVHSDTEEGRFSLNENFNSLYVGQFSVMLSILSLYHLYRNKSGKFINYFLFFFGIVIMGLSGSRSPLVSLIIVIVFILFNQRKNFKGILVGLSILLLAYFLFDDFNSILQKFGSSFIERIDLSINEGDTSGRDIRIIASYYQFLKSPVYGGAHYIQDPLILGKYPHNLLLEAFMSLGIIGGIIFIIVLIRTIILGLRITRVDKLISKNNYGWIFLIFIQFLSFGFSSGSLYSSYYLWGSLFLCMHIGKFDKILIKSKVVKNENINRTKVLL